MVKRDRIKYFFVTPGVIWVLVFTIFPLLYSFRLSFFHARLGRTPRFVWFNNFIQAFTDYRFWSVLKVTCIFVIVNVTLSVLIGLLLALLVNRPLRKPIKGLGVIRSLITLPLFTAPIALGYLGLTIFHENVGAVNTILRAFHIMNLPAWFSDPWLARLAISLVDIWQWTPFCFLVLLAGLQSLPDEVYESAALETASGWKVFRHITLPLIGPALFTVFILRMVETLKILDIPFSMTSGGPGMATQTYSFYIYLTGLRNFNTGYASALAYLLIAIMLPISLFFFKRLRQVYD